MNKTMGGFFLCRAMLGILPALTTRKQVKMSDTLQDRAAVLAAANTRDEVTPQTEDRFAEHYAEYYISGLTPESEVGVVSK